MPKHNFLQRKIQVLSKKDNSSIGKWDQRILELCERINKSEDYYTSSSCSGRIIVMVDQEKKAPGLFEFVSHDRVEFEEFMKYLKTFTKLPCSQSSQEIDKIINKKIGGANIQLNVKGEAISKNNPQLNLKFKQEPPIIHVVCRDLECAESLLNKFYSAGWKRSGIISLGKNIVVEAICTGKIEFPLTLNGKILVSEEFLKIVLGKANNNLEKGWGKIEKVKSLL